MNNIRIHDYPAIEEGNIAFPKASYWIEHRRGKGETDLILTHCLENAGLIQELLESKSAEYACSISSPKTGYRILHRSTAPEQALNWNIDEHGDPPCFTPMILTTEDMKGSIALRKEIHDVHELWDGHELVLRKGSRLAILPPFRLVDPGLSGMVIFVSCESMERGELRVEPQGGVDFVFRVHCHPDFLAHIQRSAEGQPITWNANPLVVTACFSVLQKQYAEDNGDEGWKSYFNLRQLAELLEANDCGHWSYEDFDPLEAATTLYPYQWLQENDGDNDD